MDFWPTITNTIGIKLEKKNITSFKPLFGEEKNGL